MSILKKMQNFADWSEKEMEEKNNIYFGWKTLSREESEQVRRLFQREMIYSKVWRWGLVVAITMATVILIKDVLEKSYVNFMEVTIYILFSVIAVVAIVSERKSQWKRKNGIWESRKGKVWRIEKEYCVKYFITTYFVITDDSEEISFDKNLVHGKIQEQDEVILLRTIGSKDINLCLKEDFERYMKG